MKRQTSNPTTDLSFAVLSTAIVLSAAAALALWYPHVKTYRLQLADRLATEGNAATSTQAVADLQLASWLNPGNHLVRLNLARTQLASGQTEAALAQLAKAGQGSEVARLKLRTLIELGRNDEAATAAQQLSTPADATDDDLVLSCQAFAVASHPTDCQPLEARVTTPEALQRIQRAEAGNLPLAAELHATGLLLSSSAILDQLPVSFERNLLLGRIGYQQHTASSLAASRTYLEAVVQLDPSSITAHQLLAAVYRDLGDIGKANSQDELATRLVAGRP